MQRLPLVKTKIHRPRSSITTRDHGVPRGDPERPLLAGRGPEGQRRQDRQARQGERRGTVGPETGFQKIPKFEKWNVEQQSYKVKTRERKCSLAVE